MNLLKLFNTVKYLRYKQVYYRLYYLVRNKLSKKIYDEPLANEVQPLQWRHSLLFEDSFMGNNTFSFLNVPHRFEESIDWNYDGFGKLWTYNLNYFDFLNQENTNTKKALGLILDYITIERGLKDGLEPYPISLRGINWIKFLLRHSIKEQKIDETLYRHYQILCSNLEYHLLGNHLLENGFSLYFGAYYFQCDHLYKKGKEILLDELKEQILDDGAHFELSPMYHQILLHRLLDSINLAQLNPWTSDDILPFLQDKAIKMLSWLQAVTFSNGEIPMVNDSAHGIAPSSNKLFGYAKDLGLKWDKSKLSESGYRKFDKSNMEVFIDVGNVGPDYQPGHAHSDTFNFELYLDGKPIIVDTGTSTYEKNDIRQRERETAAHNTVKLGNREQTEVWGGFRVAKRAKIVSVEEGEFWAKAIHNGYAPTMHQREFKLTDAAMEIVDTIDNQKEVAKAYFHFHPNVKNVLMKGNYVQFPDEGLEIHMDGAIEINKVGCEIANGFNKREKAWAIIASFENSLKTTIQKKPT